MDNPIFISNGMFAEKDEYLNPESLENGMLITKCYWMNTNREFTISGYTVRGFGRPPSLGLPIIGDEYRRTVGPNWLPFNPEINLNLDSSIFEWCYAKCIKDNAFLGMNEVDRGMMVSLASKEFYDVFDDISMGEWSVIDFSNIRTCGIPPHHSPQDILLRQTWAEAFEESYNGNTIHVNARKIEEDIF